MFKKIIASCISLLLLTILTATSALAETVNVTISDNGAGSDNSASVSVNNSTTVTQSNNSNLQNNVSSTVNTGENSTSSNGGNAGIDTGNAQSLTSINNQNINSNTANPSCNCEDTNVSANISGNGFGSSNALNLGLNGNIDLFQGNTAQITNNSVNQSNTGYNSANNNLGGVLIKTGNASAYTIIVNKNINFNSGLSGSGLSSISLSISGNGVNSDNLINLIFNKSLDYESKNIAVIYNNVTNNANTGGNTASNNNGSVLIATGDAVSVVTIANENINGSSAILCPTEITPPNENPQNPPSEGGGPGPGSTSVQSASGQTLGAAVGTILPKTGGYFMLLMTIFCLTMFLAGWYLRFGSGISPPFAYAR